MLGVSFFPPDSFSSPQTASQILKKCPSMPVGMWGLIDPGTLVSAHQDQGTLTQKSGCCI